LFSRIYDFSSKSDFIFNDANGWNFFIAWKKVLHDRGLQRLLMRVVLNQT
jgi:hypothetical protein